MFSASFYWNERHCYPQGHSQMSVSGQCHRGDPHAHRTSPPQLLLSCVFYQPLRHSSIVALRIPLCHPLFTLPPSHLAFLSRSAVQFLFVTLHINHFLTPPPRFSFMPLSSLLSQWCANLPLQPSRAVSPDLRTTRLLVVPYYLCVRFLSVSAAVLCLGFSLS